jgi:hypothetical protein
MTPWIVIPVFDEEATVGRVVAGARRWAPVLVVDDGSRDDSGQRAREAGADVVRHARRLGKGQALRTGLEAAQRRGASHVITLDGDGQHAPDDLPRLVAAAADDPEAIIVGSRLDEDADRALPAGRLNAIRVAGFFVNWAVGLHVHDTQSGFRVYPLGVVAGLPARRGGFVFETEVLVLASAAGVAVREVPVRAIPRSARRSRFRPIADGVAIGSYLTGRGLARWRIEAAAAGREVRAVFRSERRRARHGAMLEAGAACGGSLPAWGLAVSLVAVRRLSERLGVWWRHPRRRRATVAASATLATPLLLGAALVGVLGQRWLPDLVTPLVRRLYSQARLDPARPAPPEHPPARAASPVASGEVG